MNKFVLVVVALLIGWFLFPNFYNGKVLAQLNPGDPEYYSEGELAPSPDTNENESGCESCNEDSNCDSGTCGNSCDPTASVDCSNLDSSCTTSECLCQAVACDGASRNTEESNDTLGQSFAENEDSNTDSGTCSDSEDGSEVGSEEACAPVCQLSSSSFAATPALDRTDGYAWWLPGNEYLSSNFNQITIIPPSNGSSPSNSYEVCFSMPLNCPLGPSPNELLALRRTWNQTMDNLKAACDDREYCDKDGGTGKCSSGYNMTWPPGVAFPPAVVPNPGGGMRIYGCASFSCNPDPAHQACE